MAGVFVLSIYGGKFINLLYFVFEQLAIEYLVLHFVIFLALVFVGILVIAVALERLDQSAVFVRFGYIAGQNPGQGVAGHVGFSQQSLQPLTEVGIYSIDNDFLLEQWNHLLDLINVVLFHGKQVDPLGVHYFLSDILVVLLCK